jgi:2-keto-4-pentenoate hydratase/2-oxohepta-3-ene-1,7-dioic acid hydratase in catechol pathway
LPGKIVGIGRNYRDHGSEGNLKLPVWPKLFPKFPSAVVGPGACIERPAMTSQLDYEVEVAVVIGRTADHVSEETAMDCVAGYTVANDVSARDLQFADEQITLGKNFDGFCPLGPCITTVDELPDPGGISLSLTLNGNVMQESSTANLIFSIPYLVHFISSVMTLDPGDVILTGTPAGVGCFRDPPVWLGPGDKVECRVGGVGTLTNVIAQSPLPAPSLPAGTTGKSKETR